MLKYTFFLGLDDGDPPAAGPNLLVPTAQTAAASSPTTSLHGSDSERVLLAVVSFGEHAFSSSGFLVAAH